jgi:hypothetical protein
MICRELTLETIREVYGAGEFSTRELAETLGCREYQIRAAVSWLRLGGLVEQCGHAKRRDRGDRAYRVTTYRWTGRADIRRVSRDPDQRRRDQAPDPGLAMAWLSRAW